MHNQSIAAVVLSSSFLYAVQPKPLSNSEIFSQIHTKEVIHFEMELGFFEFRIYRDPINSDIFLLEYRAEIGKTVVFECDSAFKVIKKIKGAKSQKNALELWFNGHTYRYSGSMNALYHEG